MALNESDREDLMSEVVSLIRRIECQSADDSVVAGCGIQCDGLVVRLPRGGSDVSIR